MTKEEYSYLMHLKKAFKDKNVIIPEKGNSCIFDINSETSNDLFFLDISRKGKIELSKVKLQSRWEANKMPLVRVEIDAPEHTNPDGTTTSRNHIHIFKDGDEPGYLPWAFDLETFSDFSYNDGDSFMSLFYEFCRFCNIKTDKSNIQGVI